MTPETVHIGPELEKCFLHQNGVEIDEELNRMPYYDLWMIF